MRRTALLILAAFAACSDPGPRDRSLVQEGMTIPLHPDVFLRRGGTARAARSHVGLTTDDLAPLYPKDAQFVVRCADLATLRRHAQGRLAKFATLLPDWRLPELPPGTLLRVLCALPDGVLLDRLHPFAFVETPDGWLALVPINGEFEDADHLRRVKDRYCVAGSPDAVKAYAPGHRAGYFLSGDISVIATGEAVADLGARLTRAAGTLKVQLPGLNDFPGEAFAGVDRADLALRCSESGVRADLRIVPNPKRAGTLSTLVGALRARKGRSLGWLPANGSLTIASGCDVPSLLALADQLRGPTLDPEDTPPAASLRSALSLLGDDAAVRLNVDEGQRPTLEIVAELTEPDRRIASEFLAGGKLPDLLAGIGGPANTLEYKPDVLQYNGVSMGTVGGFPAPAVLRALRAQPVLGDPLANLFAREGRIHVAITGNRLCITMGEDARGAMESLIDRIAGTPSPSSNPPASNPPARSNGLRRAPLLEATLDAAAFLRRSHPAALAGTRERLAVELAVTTEGDALHLSLRLPLARIASVLSAQAVAPAAPPERTPPEQD